MTATLVLPSDLVRKIKLRSVNDGRKLKDTMANLLRKGLKEQTAKKVSKTSRVKLLLIHCRRSAERTPDDDVYTAGVRKLFDGPVIVGSGQSKI